MKLKITTTKYLIKGVQPVFPGIGDELFVMAAQLTISILPRAREEGDPAKTTSD